MKHQPILAAASLLFAVSAVTAASGPQAQSKAVKVDAQLMAKNVGDMTREEEEQFSNAVEATMERVCILCHPFENIVKTRRTLREWNDQVTTMATRGAPGNEADFAAVKKYLARYYGVVRVNTATAEELSSVLGLTPKAAAAVVEYRTAHGKIADLATFLKIEGVDKTKIEEQPEALRFD